MGTTARWRASLVLVLAVLRLGACSSPEELDVEAAPLAPKVGSSEDTASRGWCVDGINASGGACAAGAVDPLGVAERSLDWLLDATATASSPRLDWRDGLGFAQKDLPAEDADVASLLALDDADFAAVPAQQRRRAVVNSARHAWRGYREHAWPNDELAPITMKGVEWLNVGLTIVDALDTLLLLGLEDEATEAKNWIASDEGLSFTANKNANVFESTIRVLGGLAAAHGLGGDTVDGDLLKKALDLAEKLSPAFKTRTGIPIMDVNFKTGDPHHPKWTQKSSLAEAGTLVLEWEALEAALLQYENATSGGGSLGGDSYDFDSYHDEDSNDPEPETEYGFCPEGGGLKEYPVVREDPECDAVEEVLHSTLPRNSRARSTLPSLHGRRYRRDIADGARKAFGAVTKEMWTPMNDGLVPSAVSSGTAIFDRASHVTLGARGDSYYEYLLKHWLHVGKPEGGEASYLRAMDGVLLHLLRRGEGASENEGVVEGIGNNPLGLRWGLTQAKSTSSARKRRRRWFDAEEEVGEGAEGDKEVVEGDKEVVEDVVSVAEDDTLVPEGETTQGEDEMECECEGEPSSAEGDAPLDQSDPTAPGTPNAPPKPLGLLYVAERVGGVSGTVVHKMDHLVCFLPGVLALGYSEGLGRKWGGGDAMREGLANEALAKLGFSENATHLDVAIELARTCVSMYTSSPTGLAPEITHFPASGLKEGGKGNEKVFRYSDLLIKKKDAHNLLRPETVESLFLLYRVTGRDEWRDAGWAMWRAWEKHARVASGGYAGVDSVVDVVAEDTKETEKHENNARRALTRIDLNRIDKMESFWLSETLKYLFLLFTDDPLVVPLQCFVFNTEAHPLPVLRDGVSDGRACVERVARKNIDKLATLQGV